MLSYIWPIALVVLANTFYQICAKATPEAMNPLASLTVTYTIAALASGLLFAATIRGGSLLREYSHLNWAPFVFGLALVGLEVGFIYAYKAGWPVSAASLVASAFLAVVLIFVGFLVYKEPITVSKLIGIAICMVGLYFINKK
ncbi:MAG: EamA family transporter [Ruminiclostridium sp.]|jgi:drug/metabolite transporter (DMT)-like permease|nr:EamA family transporter [Ruminiclostridium sp.]